MLYLPRLYAILDGGAVRASGLDLLSVATELRDAGVLLLQYREKEAAATEVLDNAYKIAELFCGTGAKLVMNDLPELAVAAGWDGVHVGQKDARVEEARRIVGPRRLVGVSTHTPQQVAAAQCTSADYIAFGPIFATRSKTEAEEVVGLAGLRSLHVPRDRPFIAIGGISLNNVRKVLAAGANTVAVISALLTPAGNVKQNALRLLQEVDKVSNASQPEPL